MENMTIRDTIRKKRESPYKMLAKKHNTIYMYVYEIAKGKRTPIRGKGLLILNDLKALINEK